MGKLPIRELQFGKIDAYNEHQEYGKDMFKRSFLKYDKYEIDKFLEGKDYFICGNKGTGKTALLKYLECVLSEDPENLIIPIRFKSDFDAEDKKVMKNASDNVKEETIDETNVQNYNDIVLVWQVFLINKIINSSNEGEFLLFVDNREAYCLKKLLNGVYLESKNRLMPKISKGKAKINLSSLKGIDAELEVEIELNRDKSDVNFTKLAKIILKLFQKLQYNRNPVYVIIDELELSVKSKKENERDIILVRDLIIAVDRLNGICKKRQYNIHLIASIRNEVINNVLSSGYEINKSIEDFGINVSWYQKGGDYLDSPLLKLVENKIVASEEKHNIKDHGDVWEKYFSPVINKTEVRKYILNYTWHRPRDLVRMLTIMQSEANNADKITQEIFDRSMQLYSERSWNEIAEELSLTYDPSDIKAIRKIFTNIEVPFTFRYLNNRIRELSQIYGYIKKFSEKYKLIDVLEKLFDWGVIGNSGQRMVFKFLGDRDLAPTENMIIHTPLRNFFVVKSKKRIKVNS